MLQLLRMLNHLLAKHKETLPSDKISEYLRVIEHAIVIGAPLLVESLGEDLDALDPLLAAKVGGGAQSSGGRGAIRRRAHAGLGLRGLPAGSAVCHRSRART